MQLQIAVLSRPGGCPVNEDAYGVWCSDGACFFALSDGAGGHGGGDVASKLAVGTVLDWFRTSPECSSEAVEAALLAANRAILERQQTSVRLAAMRATAVVLALDTERGLATWGHIGDSRLYGFRGGRLMFQTRDHSVVQSMVEAGYIRPDELRHAPQRSQLLAALGDSEQFEPRILEQQFDLIDGDSLLLCTDGCWEYVEESEMEQTLSESTSPEDWLRRLEARVLALGRPGQDNYSALSIWCGPPTGEAEASDAPQ